MKTNQFIGITRSVVVAAVMFGWQCERLHAGPEPVFIHPGVPKVHSSENLRHPAFDHLISTTYPLIHSGDPTIHPDDSHLIYPADQPVIPKGAP